METIVEDGGTLVWNIGKCFWRVSPRLEESHCTDFKMREIFFIYSSDKSGSESMILQHKIFY